jgi:hypothetical protein
MHRTGNYETEHLVRIVSSFCYIERGALWVRDYNDQ